MGAAHRATVLPEHTKNMLRVREIKGSSDMGWMTQEDLWEREQ